MKWKTTKTMPPIHESIAADVEIVDGNPKVVVLSRAGVPFLRISKSSTYSDNIEITEPQPPATKEIFFVRGEVSGQQISCGPFDSERVAVNAAADLNMRESDVKKETVLDIEA